MKLYKAIIWIRSSDKPGERVDVLAGSLTEARCKLEAKDGVGSVFDLHSEEDALRPR